MPFHLWLLFLLVGGAVALLVVKLIARSVAIGRANARWNEHGTIIRTFHLELTQLIADMSEARDSLEARQADQAVLAKVQVEPLAELVPSPEQFRQGLAVLLADYSARTVEASRQLERKKAELKTFCDGLSEDLTANLAAIFAVINNPHFNGCFADDMVETVGWAQMHLDYARSEVNPESAAA
jgi:hypothetical protein